MFWAFKKRLGTEKFKKKKKNRGSTVHSRETHQNVAEIGSKLSESDKK